MNKKLFVLGLDGLSPELLEEFRDDLPAFSRLREITGDVKYTSVFPPDSVPAWVSFFTGKEPAEHGIIDESDYYDLSANSIIDADILRGKCFWDKLGERGIKSLIVNPFFVYPAWDINGTMAGGPFFIQGDSVLKTNHDAVRSVPLPPLGGYARIDCEKDFKATFDDSVDESRQLLDYTKKLWTIENPDLTFLTLLTPDRIQHFLWRFMDKKDPTYKKGNPLEGLIKEFYIFCDQMLGEILELVDGQADVLVLSDHGHGRRAYNLINFNEILRREGLLKCHGGSRRFSGPRIKEFAKKSVLKVVMTFGLQKLLQASVSRLPKDVKKSIKKGDHIIDRELSTAYASDFDGANPFGGICINRGSLSNDEFKALEDRVLDLLLNRLGEYDASLSGVVKWAKRRDEICPGEHIGKFPDILFELDRNYGVFWSVFEKIVTRNPRHETLSGGHIMEGVLLASTPELFSEKDEASLNPASVSRAVCQFMGGQ